MSLRIRILLLVLIGAAVWTLGARERDARREAAALRQRAADSVRLAAADRETQDQRAVLAEALDRLAGRPPGPQSAAEARERLMTVAASLGVEIPTAHFQPLQRAPAGALGAEVKLTATGPGETLIRFLERLESEGLPMRFDGADIAFRAAGPAVLTASAVVLWPDATTPPDPERLAADPRLGALVEWLAAPVAPSSEPPPPAPVVAAAPPPPMVEEEPPPPVAFDPEPVLQGFLDPGGDAPVRAMFLVRGEVAMAGVGDRVGAYTVLELDPPAEAVLVRPGFPSLRLTLR